ncbi:MAG: sodium:solute symporter [Ignavibacteriales bacterium CG_4_9_14_3_um_filter_30_11]|nr:MAG: sodium:solute symporter [Ignavibacteriales bacterium CG_4_9_14_3_um_filter_30_11]
MSSLSIDYIIIIVYLIAIAAFGIISGGKQKTTSDYFSGSKTIPWWAVCFSIVAAETSTLTFISIPGLAYLTNLNFLQVTFGFLLGRIVVAYVFLPAYDKGGLKTAYTYLEDRFGKKTRSFASIVFLFTRTAADGVRLFATAIPLKLMLDISYPTAIIIIAIFSLIYTYTGGLKGIIWVDVIQMFIYIGGAIIAGIFIINLLPNGMKSVFDAADSANKFSVLNLGFSAGLKNFFSNPYTLFGGIFGGMFLSMASHGTDQLIVQRLFATKNLRDGQKAVIGSGIIIVIQFTIFLILGVMLYAYYGSINVKSDEIFPMFIIKVLPAGVTGIIIAGLFAAAMSTLAASMSSLSSSTILDLYLPFTKKKLDENKKLKYSRLVTVFWAILLIFSAIFFMETSKAVVEIALSIASFTYGGLLGTFLLGIFVKNAKQNTALFGFSMGIITMTIIISFHLVSWTWFTLIGVFATIIFGKLFLLFQRKR